jgi:hypothetical protein
MIRLKTIKRGFFVRAKAMPKRKKRANRKAGAFFSYSQKLK